MVKKCILYTTWKGVGKLIQISGDANCKLFSFSNLLIILPLFSSTVLKILSELGHKK